MSKCIKVLKYMLFVFNLMFWAIGCSVIAIGIYFVVHNIYGNLFPDIPSLTTGNIFIFFGCVIMVFGFVGCMGAIKENKCLLLTFFILLLLILLTEVIMAIVLFVYEKEIGPYITTQLKSSFEKHKENNKNETIWDNIQKSMKCCGINGSKDWGNSIPHSCCPEETKQCTSSNVFQQGCAAAFTTWFENNFLYVGIVTICTSVIESFVTAESPSFPNDQAVIKPSTGAGEPAGQEEKYTGHACKELLQDGKSPCEIRGESDLWKHSLSSQMFMDSTIILNEEQLM